jgi:hypothetical protein
MKSYPPSSAVVDMQVHRSAGLETGFASDMFSQSWARCESDAYRQVARLSVDDCDTGVPAHPLVNAKAKLTRLAQVIILTLVTVSLPNEFGI